MKENLRAEWKKILGLKGAERREYIWTYYKIHIIATLATVFIVGSIINDTIINPPPTPILTIAWMGFEFDESLDAVREALNSAMIEEPENEVVHILTFFTLGDPQHDMAQQQRFVAMAAANELDIIVGEFHHIEEFDATSIGIAPADFFGDLRPFLSEAGVEPEGLRFHDNEFDGTVGFAIPIETSPVLQNVGVFLENRYLGVVVNTLRDEAVTDAIRVLWNAS